MSKVITAAKCAKLLHCSVETINELARTGELPGLQFEGRWIFVKHDLLLFLAAKAREQAADRQRSCSTPAPELPKMDQPFASISPLVYPLPPPHPSPPEHDRLQTSAPQTDELLVTAAQAASMLSMSRAMFVKTVKAGSLPAPVRLGGEARWPTSTLRSFVAQLTRDQHRAEGLAEE